MNCANQPKQSVADCLEGKTLLITGVTGLLGGLFLEKMLRSTVCFKHIYLLIGRSNKQAGDEGLKELLGSPPFSELSFESSKISALEGDLTLENIGLEENLYRQIGESVDLIVNAATSFSIEGAIHGALALNTLAPRRLLKLAQTGREKTLLHVSTLYVNGICEESLPEEALSANWTPLGQGDFDLDEEVTRLENIIVEKKEEERMTLAREYSFDKGILEVCEKKLIGEIIQRQSKLKAWWLEKALRKVGLERAKELGWWNIDTFTKAMGEQFIARDRLNTQVIILRPAVITGATKEPEKGTPPSPLGPLDSLIVQALKHGLPAMPLDSDSRVNFVPADFVVNAAFRALAIAEDKALSTYHVVAKEPLPLKRLRELIEQAFGKINAKARALQFLPQATFSKLCQREILSLAKRQNCLANLISFISLRKINPKRVFIDEDLEYLVDTTDIYTPYTHSFKANLLGKLPASEGTLPLEDRKEYPLDFESKCWDDYLEVVYMPGLLKQFAGNT